MTYQPPRNSQYPHYAQQQPQQIQHPTQLQYNADPGSHSYYGKGPVYPQIMVPNYPAYAQAYNQLPQYINPFPQSPPAPPSSQFGHVPQYGGQSVVSVTGNTSPHYTAPNAYRQYSSAPQTPLPTPPTQPNPSRTVSTVRSPAMQPPQVPQVLIPAVSPEIQQTIQQQTSKNSKPKSQSKPMSKQLQRQPGQPSVVKQERPPVDYQALLLSLADEYLNAAHSHGTMVALSRQEIDIEEYYKLVATGLGCLEAVLKVRSLVIRSCEFLLI